MTGRKIGRNDPCWCGSGKKYKRCHLDREHQPPLELWDASSRVRRVFSTKKCLVPEAWLNDCRGGICRAHTVPESSLRRIARDGHVYSCAPSWDHIQKHGLGVPERRGIHQASTFSGFCSRHDSAIFEPLENKTFTRTPEQCFLLGFRALAQELYNKKGAAELSETRRDMDKGRVLTEQVAMQALIQEYDAAFTAGCRDLIHHKQIYDGILQTGNSTLSGGMSLSSNHHSPSCVAQRFPPFKISVESNCKI